MGTPNFDLCQRVVTNLGKEENLFTIPLKDAAEREKTRSFWGFLLPSPLTVPARKALLFLIKELELEPYFNVKNGYSGPADVERLLQEAKKTIALFK